MGGQCPDYLGRGGGGEGKRYECTGPGSYLARCVLVTMSDYLPWFPSLGLGVWVKWFRFLPSQVCVGHNDQFTFLEACMSEPVQVVGTLSYLPGVWVEGGWGCMGELVRLPFLGGVGVVYE